MKLLSKYVDQTSLKRYYISYVFPVFGYGCVVWGNATNANATRLVKLQKRAARMILKADFLTPSKQLFKKLNWLAFPKRVQYHTCLMVYKGIKRSAPEYISSMLTYVSEKHERDTRSTALDLLHIPRSHTSFFDRAFSVQGPKLWNSLPADIRNSPTINRFKSALKRYLLINSKLIDSNQSKITYLHRLRQRRAVEVSYFQTRLLHFRFSEQGNLVQICFDNRYYLESGFLKRIIF